MVRRRGGGTGQGQGQGQSQGQGGKRQATTPGSYATDRITSESSSKPEFIPTQFCDHISDQIYLNIDVVVKNEKHPWSEK